MTSAFEYAARIRAARAYAGITQRELARQLGIDTQTVKRREAGQQAPKRGEVLAIAAVCGVPPAFMEHGFGDSPHEIVDRLDRIEAALGGALAGVRDYVGELVSELNEAAGAAESPAPSALPAPDPAQAGRRLPPARSRRRS